MPKSQRPRHKKAVIKRQINPTVKEHLHCPAEVRWLVDSPEAAELYCLAHQKHISYLTQPMARLFEDALRKSSAISSSY